MSKKSKEDPRTPVQYRIPVQSSSDVELACTGTIVDRATLEIGGSPISVLTPDYGTKDRTAIMELDFLGGKPLHAGLLDSNATVILQCDGVPSLMIHEKPPVTWPDVGADNLVEDVTVGTFAGAKKNKLIYFGGSAVLARDA